ncbi:H-NS family nucleoid-associated regulatory protein [Ralstonia solanacearum]|nr:H-NS histone family protein [Ralstonia solanacearum]MDB0576074.1 H-NS histone family protein [Ralstonia solanacearum]QOK84564.1 H-NS histone family protein [Ralstonia solanacearum]RIJ85190.1 hypothetical protein RSP822_17285 [Ralstonia solanacearum]
MLREQAVQAVRWAIQVSEATWTGRGRAPAWIAGKNSPDS